MARADFYLIDKPRFRDNPLLLVCELARRAQDQQIPTLIHARDRDQAEALDALLWDFDPDAFVPHQLAGDEDDDLTPVLIVPPDVDSPLRALVINLRDSAVAGQPEAVKEVVAADPAEREGSRARWTEYKSRGFELRKFDM
ncbi:MAG: DNA polymerase III subunit chi [Xanthomonadales bacterium]|nr:DNA polymerase III subunit chi [Xanthomonadales bacterium]MBK7144147.1 DNA polymerase III subunit chi [Xanthomonadales bacterium]MCC6561085.1 DNA polymerase III subunit chi [Xanthomonadales bacterium]